MSRRAFTLLEVLVALALALAVLAVVLPAASGIFARGSRVGVQEILTGALRSAREISMREGVPIELVAIDRPGFPTTLRARTIGTLEEFEPASALERSPAPVNSDEAGFGSGQAFEAQDLVDEELAQLPAGFRLIGDEDELVSPSDSNDAASGAPFPGAPLSNGPAATRVLAIVLPAGRIVPEQGWSVREERAGEPLVYRAVVQVWTGAVALERESPELASDPAESDDGAGRPNIDEGAPR